MTLPTPERSSPRLPIPNHYPQSGQTRNFRAFPFAVAGVPLPKTHQKSQPTQSENKAKRPRRARKGQSKAKQCKELECFHVSNLYQMCTFVHFCRDFVCEKSSSCYWGPDSKAHNPHPAVAVARCALQGDEIQRAVPRKSCGKLC